jgi:CHASE1-domain containing sensor protein
MKEHQAYIRNRHFSKSGIAEHQRFCDGQVNFDKPKILATVTGKNRHQVEARLQTREAMEIRLHKTGLGGQGFNKDNGNQVVTNHWDPLLTKIRRGLGFDTEDTNVKNL